MKSVRTALRVFEEVAARQPVGLSELSRRLNVPKASVQRALTTLADAGWLRHDVSAPGSWVVTARFSVLADASPEVIAVLDGDRMVLLAGPEETLLRTLSATQGPLPVHLSAAGRAILARLPDAKVDEVLERSLPHTSDGTGEVLERHVRQSVDDARRDGYSLVRGEYVDALGVVAAAVVDGHGAPVAALAVMVPRDRIDRGEGPELGALLVDAAETVSLAVQAAEGRR